MTTLQIQRQTTRRTPARKKDNIQLPETLIRKHAESTQYYVHVHGYHRYLSVKLPIPETLPSLIIPGPTVAKVQIWTLKDAFLEVAHGEVRVNSQTGKTQFLTRLQDGDTFWNSGTIGNEHVKYWLSRVHSTKHVREAMESLKPLTDFGEYCDEISRLDQCRSSNLHLFKFMF